MSAIEWTDEGWPVVTGCTPVSTGCRYCWAARLAATRLKNNPRYRGLALGGEVPRWTGKIRFNWDVWKMPSGWRRPRRVFVAPMGDLFHEQVADATLGFLFDVMRDLPRHTFQVLTKRPQRMAEWVLKERDSGRPTVGNVWLGVSCEDQRNSDYRIAILENIDWPVKWVSFEPLIGPVDLGHDRDIDWMVIGGETGRFGKPLHPQWVRDLIDLRGRAAVFFKSWGEWLPDGKGDYTRALLRLDGVPYPIGTMRPEGGAVVVTRVGRSRSGRMLDGRTWDEFPPGGQDGTQI